MTAREQAAAAIALKRITDADVPMREALAMVTAVQTYLTMLDDDDPGDADDPMELLTAGVFADSLVESLRLLLKKG